MSGYFKNQVCVYSNEKLKHFDEGFEKYENIILLINWGSLYGDCILVKLLMQFTFSEYVHPESIFMITAYRQDLKMIIETAISHNPYSKILLVRDLEDPFTITDEHINIWEFSKYGEFATFYLKKGNPVFNYETCDTFLRRPHFQE